MNRLLLFFARVLLKEDPGFLTLRAENWARQIQAYGKVVWRWLVGYHQ